MRIKLDIPISIEELGNLISSGDLRDCTAKEIQYICTDSRVCKAQDLFFPLSKSKEEALSHIEEAKRIGCYIAAESYFHSNSTISPQNSLLKIAKLYKSKLKKLKYTIAITGSIGKTTTKELVRTILCEKYAVHSNSGNANNSIGVSYTIFSAPADTEVLVLELGMNHSGEIKELTECLNPDIAIITCITSAHIGNLGTRANIAKAKLEIVSSPKDELITLVPYEEPLLSAAYNKRTVSITDPKANFFLFPLDIRKSGSIFDFYSESAVFTAKKISIPGRHILIDTAFALAVASILKLSRQEIENGLNSFSEIVFRQKITSVGRFRVYDDTYSSSPEAALSMLKLLSLFEPYKKSACLGDMLELGSYSHDAHYSLGKEVFLCGFKKLYTFGSYAQIIADGAIDAGMPKSAVFINQDKNSPEISARQIAESYSDELILFKASHALSAERIYGYLKKL